MDWDALLAMEATEALDLAIDRLRGGGHYRGGSVPQVSRLLEAAWCLRPPGAVLTLSESSIPRDDCCSALITGDDWEQWRGYARTPALAIARAWLQWRREQEG